MLANHTYDHNTVAQSNVDQGKSAIETAFGNTVYTIAYPNGTQTYETYSTGKYILGRGVSDGLYSPGNETAPDPLNSYCYIPATGAAASAFNSETDSARSGGKWRVVLVHGFTGGSDGAYQPVDIAQFLSAVNYSKGLTDVWIDSYVNVGSYWRGQNAFAKATSTTTGTSQTWTWTLPAAFPPGKYLRVTVPGGTLTQGGTALAWDSHGYYEVALDAGSLTISP